MAKRNPTTAPKAETTPEAPEAEATNPNPAPEADTTPAPEADADEAAAIAAIEEDENKPRSVVGVGYKREYKERALEAGNRGKAPKRSRWDWLAQRLAESTLTKDKSQSLIVPAFEAVLEANGIAHSHWNRTTKGWQGRLRMTGRLALQRVVAETGTLRIGEETLAAPAEWLVQYRR